MEGTTVAVTLWMLALTTPSGAVVESPGRFTSQEACAAAAVAQERAYGGRARCTLSGTINVPAPYTAPQPEKR